MVLIQGEAHFDPYLFNKNTYILFCLLLPITKLCFYELCTRLYPTWRLWSCYLCTIHVLFYILKVALRCTKMLPNVLINIVSLACKNIAIDPSIVSCSLCGVWRGCSQKPLVLVGSHYVAPRFVSRFCSIFTHFNFPFICKCNGRLHTWETETENGVQCVHDCNVQPSES